MAQDLVQLDEVRRPLLEPLRKPLVELGSRRLRKRVVGRVADQEVPESVGVVPRELRAIGPDELLPDECQQSLRHVRVAVRERPHRTLVEHPSFHRAALEHGSLSRVELVEPRCQQRLDRRWNLYHGAARSVDEREHLLDEQRISLGGVTDPPPQLVVHAAERVQERIGFGGVERLEQDRRRVQLPAGPRRPPVEQLGTRHAEEQERAVPRQIGDVLDQREERLLPPVEIVEDSDERRFLRLLLEKLAESPGDLVGRRRSLRGAEQRSDRRGGRFVGRKRVQPLEHLDHRPVRDPLPVGEAAAAHDAPPRAP